MTDSRRHLEAEHRPDRIRERIREPARPGHFADAMLGAVDGAVTTFAVVAGAVGGGFGSGVVIVLGFASLLADGFSMAVSNFLGSKSRGERLDRARRQEERHVREIPEGEALEVRQIFRDKGFRGETLDQIVDVITEDRKRWVDTMLIEEHGLSLEPPRPWRAALTTFTAFVCVGAVPLVVFVLPGLTPAQAFAASGAATGVAFFAVGSVKGLLLRAGAVRSGVETLALGGTAALLAFLVARFLRSGVAP